MMAIPVVDPSVSGGKISVMAEPLLKQNMLDSVRWNGESKKLILALRDEAVGLAIQRQLSERTGDRLAAVWHGKVVGVFTDTRPMDSGLQIPLQLPDAEALQLERELHAALTTEQAPAERPVNPPD